MSKKTIAKEDEQTIAALAKPFTDIFIPNQIGDAVINLLEALDANANREEVVKNMCCIAKQAMLYLSKADRKKAIKGLV